MQDGGECDIAERRNAQPLYERGAACEPSAATKMDGGALDLDAGRECASFAQPQQGGMSRRETIERSQFLVALHGRRDLDQCQWLCQEPERIMLGVAQQPVPILQAMQRFVEDPDPCEDVASADQGRAGADEAAP